MRKYAAIIADTGIGSFKTVNGINSFVTRRRTWSGFRSKPSRFQNRKRYKLFCDQGEKERKASQIREKFQNRKRYKLFCDLGYMYKEFAL